MKECLHMWGSGGGTVKKRVRHKKGTRFDRTGGTTLEGLGEVRRSSKGSGGRTPRVAFWEWGGLIAVREGGGGGGFVVGVWVVVQVPCLGRGFWIGFVLCQGGWNGFYGHQIFGKSDCLGERGALDGGGSCVEPVSTLCRGGTQGSVLWGRKKKGGGSVGGKKKRRGEVARGGATVGLSFRKAKRPGACCLGGSPVGRAVSNCDTGCGGAGRGS